MYIFDPVFIKSNPFTLQDIFCAKRQTQTELLSPCEIEGFCQKCSVFFFFNRPWDFQHSISRLFKKSFL